MVEGKKNPLEASTILNILNSNLQCNHTLKTCQVKFFSIFISLKKYYIYSSY